MTTRTRSRFIFTATALYVAGALAWILLSDQLLMQFTDLDSLAALSTVKGVFFVLASGALFFCALRAVPAGAALVNGPMLGAVSALAPGESRRALHYGFAIALTLASLALRAHLPYPAATGQAPLMLLMPAIIVSAALGGGGPGLTATLLASLLSGWPLLATSSDQMPMRLLYWSFLPISGVLVSVLCAMLRSTLRQVQLQRRLTDAVVSGTTDAIFVKDKAGRYLYANQAAAAFMGQAPERIVGRDDAALFPPESAALLRARDLAVMAGGVIEQSEEQLELRDGRRLVFSVTKGPLRDDDGAVSGLFGVSRDVTEHKLAEQALRVNEQRLQMAIEATSDSLWDWDLRTGKLYQTDRVYQLTGLDPAEDTGDLAFFLRPIHHADLGQVQRHLEQHRCGALRAIDIDFRIRLAGAGLAWVKARGGAVERDAGGYALRMVGTLSDITERKRFELVQREAATVFASSHDGIVVLNAARRITKVNPAFERITGYLAADVLDRSAAMLATSSHPLAFYRELWRAVRRHGFWRGEIWSTRSDGELYAELLSISAVRDQAGAIEHYIGVFSDITHIKAHEAELDKIANYDPLTGAPNRRLLADRFEHALRHAARTGHTLAVCLLDLDGFKMINDRHGHPAGDQLLVGVARNLGAAIRADDTLARIGGDEFVLLLSDVGTPEACTRALERILVAASLPVEIGGAQIAVSASIGVSLYPGDEADADTLLRHADQAMYRAKEAGKNRYQLFDPAGGRQAQAQRIQLERLALALERNEFVLHYQPKVNLRSGALVGAEALIRWQHPERGLLAPAEFLQSIMGSRLEPELGAWVVGAALAQMAAWRAAGLRVPVSVNVGACQMMAPGFADGLAEALARQPQLSPADLELEVLESAAIPDFEHAIAVLARCKQLGVRIALDDFGTGYSSLTYLRRLPADTLKVDQSFVRDMLADKDDYGIVAGVVKLAQAFGRAVVAEGVETPAHCAALVELGCELGQGYGIARPMPASQLPAWLGQRGRPDRDAAGAIG